MVEQKYTWNIGQLRVSKLRILIAYHKTKWYALALRIHWSGLVNYAYVGPAIKSNTATFNLTVDTSILFT